MIRFSILQLFIFLFILGQGIISHGQNQSNRENHYQWFDEVVGLKNIGLFNGTRYKEKYRTKNGNHKFYVTSEYSIGNIVYDQEPYFNVKMKYDIHEDQVIISIPNKAFSGDIIFQLLAEKIDQFSLYDKYFIKMENLDDNISGFYEIIFKNSNFVLYKKNIKTKTKIIDNKSIFYDFNVKNYYLILSKGEYSEIQSHKDLIKLFPEHKREIKSFIKTQKRLKKSNYDLYMTKLMNDLSNAIGKNSISIL